MPEPVPSDRHPRPSSGSPCRGGVPVGGAGIFLLLCLAATGPCAVADAAPPGGAPRGEAVDHAAVERETLAFHAGMVEFVGQTRLTDAGVRSVIDHFASFRAVFREEPRSRLRAHYEETGSYDFSVLPRMPEVARWAAASGVDARAWLSRACRAELLQTRGEQAQGLEDYRKALAESEEILALLDDPQLRKLVEDVRWLTRVAEKMLALIPAPDDDERKVLEKHGDALRRVLPVDARLHAAVAAAPPARASEGDASDYAALEAETLAFHAGMVKLVGQTRLTDAGARTVIDHFASFRTVFREEPRSRLRAHYEETGSYDFSVLPGMPEVARWAGASGVDARAWLSRACRAELLQTRGEQAQRLDEYRKKLAKWEDDPTLPSDARLQKQAEEARWVIRVAERMLALIPAPDDDEKKVVEERGEALRKALRE